MTIFGASAACSTALVLVLRHLGVGEKALGGADGAPKRDAVLSVRFESMTSPGSLAQIARWLRLGANDTIAFPPDVATTIGSRRHEGEVSRCERYERWLEEGEKLAAATAYRRLQCTQAALPAVCFWPPDGDGTHSNDEISR